MWNLETIIWAIAIFFLRICDVSLGTFRVLTVIRGWRAVSTIIAFGEVLIFIVVISRVITHIDTWINVLAYASGYATGTFVGMTLERYLAPGSMRPRVVSQRGLRELADRLRERGFGVTELSGNGRDGPVVMLESIIEKKQLPAFIREIDELDPRAFVTCEDVKRISRRRWSRTGKVK